jgi:hypothetical protein
MNDEEHLRSMCARLLCGAGEEGDEELLGADEELARELASRLAACGVTLVRNIGQAPLCVVEDSDDELPELALACLALCAVALQGAGSRRRARLTVTEIWQRVGQRDGYNEAYVRRAGLGPLEVRGLVHVTKPAQRAQDAYVTAGPALRAIDGSLLAARLRSLTSPTAA